MTEQQTYGKKTRKSTQKKADDITKTTKRGYKNWLVINTKDYLKNKNQKRNTQELDTTIFLKKKNKK